MNEMQSKLLEAFSCFHDICVDNGLNYFACGGTLLGAVRHHGFIPWDDDVDVWMPRPDYEKLISILGNKKTGKYLFETPKCNAGNHYYAMGKFYDTTTTLIEKLRFPVKKGVFIDVFPMDGLGKTEKERDRIFRKMHLKNMMIASRTSIPRKQRSALKNMAIRISSLLPESVINTEKMIVKFDRQCAALPYEGSKYAGVLMGAYGMRDVVPMEWLKEPAIYDFESIKIYGIRNYDECLTYIFGDWRKLPPKEKQVSLHDFELLDLEHGYLE